MREHVHVSLMGACGRDALRAAVATDSDSDSERVCRVTAHHTHDPISSFCRMSSFFSALLQWLSGLFFSKTAEIAIVGLQVCYELLQPKRALLKVVKASGKTSFVNVLGTGQWSEDVVPTISFNLRKVKKGNVTLKIWDVAGQPKYRSLWERYCNGVDALVFVVDSADKEKFETARFELHQLLSQSSLLGVPLLVLGNKNDIDGHASVNELIKALQLDKITNRPVSCYSCSMKSQHNLDIVLQWLAARSH
ncbi:hypothetical protein ACG7TL_006333 [Trametes sanguinea]